VALRREPAHAGSLSASVTGSSRRVCPQQVLGITLKTHNMESLICGGIAPHLNGGDFEVPQPASGEATAAIRPWQHEALPLKTDNRIAAMITHGMATTRNSRVSQDKARSACANSNS
jgi:hypothetical protein